MLQLDVAVTHTYWRQTEVRRRTAKRAEEATHGSEDATHMGPMTLNLRCRWECGLLAWWIERRHS
jgi:hypothetical protein